MLRIARMSGKANRTAAFGTEVERLVWAVNADQIGKPKVQLALRAVIGTSELDQGRPAPVGVDGKVALATISRLEAGRP